MRFIDRAAHGGCSKKASAVELRSLLSKVHGEIGGKQLRTLANEFPDTGSFEYEGTELLSTVDLVLPMVIRPSDFGRITAYHVLSDLYACLATPLFAICILGVPKGLSVDDPEVCEVLAAAARTLGNERTALVGGHTMAEQDDFYLGFAAVGVPRNSPHVRTGPPRVGDSIILTKPLGTSIATLRWKTAEAGETEHSDVLDGMMQSNRGAANCLARYPIPACTDVTGYGFAGHLHNVLRAHEVAARISVTALPYYPSLQGLRLLEQTRQYWNNREYVAPHVKGRTTDEEFTDRLLYDSQVSGGLLVVVRKENCKAIMHELIGEGYHPAIIGEIAPGHPGSIHLTD